MRAVIFDLWYTLVSPEDFRPRGRGSTSMIPDVLGFDPDLFKPFWQERFEARMRGEVTLRRCLEEHLASISRTLSQSEWQAFDDIWRHHDDALGNVRPEVVEGLQVVRDLGLKTGLLSNVHDREVRAWQASPLCKFFDEVCFSHEIRCAKPDPVAYATVLEAVGVPASEAAFVGDGASKELQGARAAGFGKVVFMRGFAAELLPADELEILASDADCVIDRIGELSSVL